jgi:hypothetical protein
MKTPASRRIFFWTLFCSYFIITTSVILLAFGYRFDVVKNIFIHSGSITLKSNPQKIEVEINGKKPKARYLNIINNSYQINGLRPGEYNLNIKADEFKDWNKTISVHSGLSTEFWNVILLRKNYERTEFNTPKIENFYPAPKEFLFAYTTQQDNDLIVKIINTNKNKILNELILKNVKFTNNSYKNIEWSPNSSGLIIPVIKQADNSISKTTSSHLQNEQIDYVIFDLKTDQHFYLSEMIDLTISSPKTTKPKIKNTSSENKINQDEQNKTMFTKPKIISARWHPENKNSIYFQIDNQLNLAEFNLKTQKLKNQINIFNDLKAYDFADDGIYLLNSQDELLYDNNLEATDLKIITKFTTDNNDDENYRLISYDKNRIILINNKTGNLYLYNKGERDIYSPKLATNIINAHFSNDGKKLIYHSPFEMSIYFTRDWETQPIRFENETQSITRFSQEISNVHFDKNYEHIIFSVDNEIKIIELDTRWKNDIQTVLTLNTNQTKLISDHRNDLLFFIDEVTNENDEKETKLFSIEFPEKEGLFN